MAESTYDFTLDPLYAKIDVDKSTVNVTPNKIEILLQKLGGKDATGKWPALEGVKPTTDMPKISSLHSAALASSADQKLEQPNDSDAPDIKKGPQKTEKAPAYPTSSRKGVKDWDAVAQDALKKEIQKNSDGKDTNAELEDLDEGDPLGGFFKQLYEKADPDTRRAMMKSYVESNGTALSTNWAEVGQKKVETTPPDGMEAKKWS